ncbi:MAG TPA: hypothetical protein VFN64_02440 [Burkholderiaceae bacterium]|nr:hypothetical protein [Burkholderiaceae bacterium]
MSILIRAALLGGIAYLITRSLSGRSAPRRALARSRPSASTNELDSGQDNLWPTSESQQTARTAAVNASPDA